MSMGERAVREEGKEGDPVANLRRNQTKVGEEEVGEAQEEDLQRNLTVAEGDTGAAME